MDFLALLPVLEAFLPTVEQVALSAVAGPVEKAAIQAVLSGVKSVIDAHAATSKPAVVAAK